MINVPESVQHGTVKMHIISGSADSKADDDLRPDATPVNGTIILKPTVSSLKVTSATPPTTMLLDTLRCPIIEGVLYPPGTELDETETTLEGVILVSSDQPATQPTSLQWKATFDLSSTTKLSPITFNVPVNGVIDLTTVIPAVASPGTVNVITTETADRAETAADAAEADAATASAKATAAASSATAAKTSETKAAAEAATASAKATAAASSATAAKTSETKAEKAAGRAEASADAASGSASAAHDSQVVIMGAHSDVMSAVEAVDQDRQWAMAARAGAEQAAGRAETAAGQAEASAVAASGSASAAHDSQVLAVDAKRDAESAAETAGQHAETADLSLRRAVSFYPTDTAGVVEVRFPLDAATDDPAVIDILIGDTR